MNWITGSSVDTGGCEFWTGAERSGWLQKQGTWMRSWRRRWFVLKDGKLFWFLSDTVTQDSQPRGIIEVAKCLAIKGAEDAINKEHAFEISTHDTGNMYFIADDSGEKEDWINAIGRAIVRRSRSVLQYEQTDYTSRDAGAIKPQGPS